MRQDKQARRRWWQTLLACFWRRENVEQMKRGGVEVTDCEREEEWKLPVTDKTQESKRTKKCRT